MKKLLILLFTLLLVTACSSNNNQVSNTDDKSLKISCTAEPHATILEYVKPKLEEKGYKVDIQILDNYYIFNEALDNGDVDANYFQHLPFFDDEVLNKAYDIENAGGIHIEPFGIYSTKVSDIKELKDGAEVIISNSIADHGRILFILKDAGLITLNDDASPISATIEDIKENPLNLKFIEVNPEFLTTAYNNNEGDLVAINGNYAIAAGLNPLKEAIILESATNENPYVNIVACKKGEKESNKIKDLVEILTSDDTKSFIKEHFGGAVIPVE